MPKFGFFQIMNKNDSSEIDISLKDFPDNLTYLIKESLDSKNSVNKLAARSILVGLGKSIIPKLHRLLSSEKGLLCMETAKIIKLKADGQELGETAPVEGSEAIRTIIKRKNTI